MKERKKKKFRKDLIKELKVLFKSHNLTLTTEKLGKVSISSDSGELKEKNISLDKLIEEIEVIVLKLSDIHKVNETIDFRVFFSYQNEDGEETHTKEKVNKKFLNANSLELMMEQGDEPE
jgi:hypothetical protein